MSALKLSSLNIFSAVNKTGNIHDIHEFRLDLLALCETKIHKDDPPVIKDSIAPPDGFSALYVHCDPAA